MPNQDESTDSGQASASQLAELQRQLQQLQAQAQANQGTYPTSIPVGKIRKALNESKVNLTGHGDNKGQAFRAWLQSLSGLGNEFHLLKRFLKDARNECNTESDPLLTAEHDDAFLAVLKAATSGYARELLEEEETTNGSSGRDALRALEAYCTPKTYSEKLAMSCNLTHKMPMDIPSKSDPRESITKYNRECANLKRLYGIELLQVQQVGCVLRSLPSTYDELKRKLMQKSHDPGISLDELTEKIQNHWSTFLNPETNGGRANTVVHAQALAASTDARGRGTRYGAGGAMRVPMHTEIHYGGAGGRGRGRGRGHFHQHQPGRGGQGGRGAGRGGRANSGQRQLRQAQVLQKTHQREVQAEENKSCYICKQPGHIAPNCPQKRDLKPSAHHGLAAVREPQELIALASYRHGHGGHNRKVKADRVAHRPKEQHPYKASSSKTPLREVHQNFVMEDFFHPVVLDTQHEWNHSSNRANWHGWYKNYLHGYIESQLEHDYMTLEGYVPRQPCCGCIRVHTVECPVSRKIDNSSPQDAAPPAVQVARHASTPVDQRANHSDTAHEFTSKGTGADVTETMCAGCDATLPQESEAAYADSAAAGPTESPVFSPAGHGLRPRIDQLETINAAFRGRLVDAETKIETIDAVVARNSDDVTRLQSRVPELRNELKESIRACKDATTEELNRSVVLQSTICCNFQKVVNDTVASLGKRLSRMEELLNERSVAPRSQPGRNMVVRVRKPRVDAPQESEGELPGDATNLAELLDAEDILALPQADGDDAELTAQPTAGAANSLSSASDTASDGNVIGGLDGAPVSGEGSSGKHSSSVSDDAYVDDLAESLANVLLGISRDGTDTDRQDIEASLQPSRAVTPDRNFEIPKFRNTENPKSKALNRNSCDTARQQLTAELFDSIGSPMPSYACKRVVVSPVTGARCGASTVCCAASIGPYEPLKARNALAAHVGGTKDASRVPTVLDSGANACMFKDKDCFISLDMSCQTVWTVADNRAKLASAGTGTVVYPVVNSVTGETLRLELSGVCYCPTATFNLLSVSELEDQHGIYCDFNSRAASTRDGQVQIEIVRRTTGSTYHLAEPEDS